MSGSNEGRSDEPEEPASSDLQSQHSSWLIWHAAAVAIVTFAPAQIYLRQPIWAVRENQRLSLIALAVGYGVAALLLTGWARGSRRATIGKAVASVLIVFGIVFFALFLFPGDASRGAIGLALVFSVVLMAASTLLAGEFWMRSGVLASVAAAGVLLALGIATQDRFEPAGLRDRIQRAAAVPENESKQIASHLYTLESRTYRNYIGVDVEMAGGGLAALGDGLIVATAEGRLHAVAGLEDATELRVRKLSLEIPLERAAYDEDFGANTEPSFLRVTDILVDESPQRHSGVDLYAVYTAWRSTEECIVMQISRTQWKSAEAIWSDQPAEWSTVYASSTCGRFQSENQGGRLVLTADHRLILALGDFDHDGVVHPERFAQDPKVDYGKILEIDPRTGTARILSLGHRNPQGLVATRDGSIWSTEHGPRGGDELNRLVEGANYGWPIATYGTAYYSETWPLSAVPGSHANYQRPSYSWVPSVATSNLIAVEGSSFPLWHGDFLVGTLKDRALHRVRMEQNVAIYSERIEIGERIRDLIVDRAGRLVLWTDEGALVSVVAAEGALPDEISAATGQRLFATCAECHGIAGSNDAGGRTAGAPDLLGVFGRTIASSPRFAYSAGLRETRGSWDAERLDAFLENPRSIAVGAGGGMPGVPDANARASLIEYLKALR